MHAGIKKKKRRRGLGLLVVVVRIIIIIIIGEHEISEPRSLVAKSSDCGEEGAALLSNR